MQDFQLIWMGSKGKRVLLQLRIDVWSPGSRFRAWGIKSNQTTTSVGSWVQQSNTRNNTEQSATAPNCEHPHNSKLPQLSLVILDTTKVELYNRWSIQHQSNTNLFLQKCLASLMHFFDGSDPSFDWSKEGNIHSQYSTILVSSFLIELATYKTEYYNIRRNDCTLLDFNGIKLL